MTAASSPGCVLAATRTGRPAISRRRPSRTRFVGGGRRHVELQVPGNRHALRPEPAQPLRVGRRLRQEQRHALQYRARYRREGAPCTERAIRHARIDDYQRHAAALQRPQDRRPEFRFREEHEAGPPMVEKGIDRAWRVDRHELMDRPLRQMPACHLARLSPCRSSVEWSIREPPALRRAAKPPAFLRRSPHAPRSTARPAAPAA